MDILKPAKSICSSSRQLAASVVVATTAVDYVMMRGITALYAVWRNTQYSLSRVRGGTMANELKNLCPPIGSDRVGWKILAIYLFLFLK